MDINLAWLLALALVGAVLLYIDLVQGRKPAGPTEGEQFDDWASRQW